MIFSFKEYLPSLSDKSKAELVLDSILKLNPQNNVITIDLNGLIAMTTICARIIFGQLYKTLGQDLFEKNIKIVNAEETIRIVIKWGVAKEIEQSLSSIQ